MDQGGCWPIVKKYLDDKSLPFKALIMESAPAHPQDLKETIEEFSWLSVEFLPPVLQPQPMDQYSIANFKKLYTKELSLKCFQMFSGIYLILKDLQRILQHPFLCGINWEILQQCLSKDSETGIEENMA